MKKLLLVLLLPLVAGVAFADDSPSPKLNQSIFRMYMNAGDQVAGAGSVTYTDQGLMTCFHCVEMLGKAYYRRVPGKPLEVVGFMTAEVIDAWGVRRDIVSWERIHADIVVLVLDGEIPENWVPLKWGAMPVPGDMVKAAGYFGYSGFGDKDKALLSVSVGYMHGAIIELARAGPQVYLTHSAPVASGMSGSALLNTAGEVIGITSWVGGSGWAQSGAGRPVVD